MGYRSKVRFSVTEEGYKFMADRCGETYERVGDEPPLLGDGAKMDVYMEHEGCIVFGWDDVKWYPFYPEVVAVEDAYRDTVDAGHPGQRLVIGEDYDDVERTDDDYSGDLKCHLYPICLPDVLFM